MFTDPVGPTGNVVSSISAGSLATGFACASASTTRAAAGVIVSEHLSFPTRTFETCSDGAHGVWITWQSDVFVVQHIGPNGEFLRGPEPVVTNSTGWQSRPRIVGDAHGGAYVFWAEGTVNAFPHGVIRGQHFTADGRAQ